jgi:DNA-binding PadR family transcriptional regulator
VSTTRLLVLGVVRIFQPVHGYDVRRELVSWHAEEWANVAPGSIYNALKSLVKDGLLEVVGTKQIGARPERTTYKLTPRGEAEMMELLRETLWQVATPVDPLVAALSFMWFLDRKELVSALEARAAKIRGNLAHAEHVVAAIDDIETPIHVRTMMQLLNARMGSELAWSEQFRKELAAGKYRTKGDPEWKPPGAGKKSDKHPGPKPAKPRQRKRAK